MNVCMSKAVRSKKEAGFRGQWGEREREREREDDTIWEADIRRGYLKEVNWKTNLLSRETPIFSTIHTLNHVTACTRSPPRDIFFF